MQLVKALSTTQKQPAPNIRDTHTRRHALAQLNRQSVPLCFAIPVEPSRDTHEEGEFKYEYYGPFYLLRRNK